MSPSRSLQPRRLATILLGAMLAASVGASGALAEDIVQPIDFSHNVKDAPAPVTGTVWASGPKERNGKAVCTTPTQTTSNVNTDCEGTNPHNETSIAVNPTNAANLIGGANDYQLAINPGGHVGETIHSRAHVTFDGGRTWSMYPLSTGSAYQATGDPSVAFDAAGHAYYATLGFRFVGPVNAQSPDVLVSNSGDGGRTWATSRIAQGSGVFTSVGKLLDKEYVTAWGNGNAIVTYGQFRLGRKGSFLAAQIYASVTHNSGGTWSTPTLISGSLDEAFVSIPVVAGNRIFVAFLNTTDLSSGRDDYEVVEVNPTTGALVAGPFKVATTIDGFTDYPIGFGRQTYHDSLFRTWAAGNIAADPGNAAHLAVVWSDMRNSPTPANSDPYAALTNSDVVLSESFDSGRTWGVPTVLDRAGDQFMPWAAYDTNRRLRIGFFDRNDVANHTYAYSLATETSPGSATFGIATISTANSDPTTGNRWFAATLNPGFPFATTFLGDYSNIAPTADGGVVAYWTDLRNEACFGSRCGHGEDAYFARVAP